MCIIFPFTDHFDRDVTLTSRTIQLNNTQSDHTIPIFSIGYVLPWLVGQLSSTLSNASLCSPPTGASDHPILLLSLITGY